MELYKKHRPTVFKGLYGQEGTVKLLLEMVKSEKVPHSLLIAGPSGCGKTTIARILKNKLGCSDHDFFEVNCADFRGIDTIREIRQRMQQAPIGGTCRIWLIDESQKLSGDAQNAFLKILEDTPRHVYFFLCTTDPNKMIKTIRTRCSDIVVKALTPTAMTELVKSVAEAEKLTLSDEVVERLVEVADGSARRALVILDQIANIESDEERLEAIRSSDTQRQAIELARALINPKATWPEVAKILSQIEEEPESLRYMVLGYANAIMLKGGNGPILKRAYCLINAFRDNYFDSKKAGLIASCYEVVTGS